MPDREKVRVLTFTAHEQADYLSIGSTVTQIYCCFKHTDTHTHTHTHKHTHTHEQHSHVSVIARKTWSLTFFIMQKLNKIFKKKKKKKQVKVNVLCSECLPNRAQRHHCCSFHLALLLLSISICADVKVGQRRTHKSHSAPS